MLRLFALSSFFLAFNNIYLTRKRVERRNWVIVGVVLLQSALNLLFAVVLTPVWGLSGIGAAFFVSQGLTTAVILI
jgi:O-antigen/teichoic acid export membrane protein